MCRNTHNPDASELRTTAHRHSLAESEPAPSNHQSPHHIVHSSFSTNPSSSYEQVKSLQLSPRAQVVDLGEVCTALNSISVKLEQSAQNDDRNLKYSSKLASIQRVNTERASLTDRNSIDSRQGFGKIEEELEKQMNEIYMEMAGVMEEVEQLSQHTLALTKKG